MQKILKRLEFNNGKFPHGALLDAIDNRSRIIPELLKIIKQAKEKALDLIENENENVNDSVRIAALRGLAALVSC